jgi:ABC-type lipoprotein export system ATPase subunit
MSPPATSTRSPDSASPTCCSRSTATSGTSLILVTHDLRLAARCQHQIRLEAGRRVA